MKNALKEAIAEYESLLGHESVITNDEELEIYNTATYTTSNRASAVIKPNSADLVQEVVRIASKYQVPLYPISTGKNWGYGSAVPTSDGAVIVDLSNMNRIIEYNDELGYVTLEPGVTQFQLYAYLQEHEGKYWMDATGASGNCSVLGNTVERGFGHTAYGDHFSHTCGFEIVLPNGEKINTGFGRFANASAASTYKWGVGPYIDGLFTQSNLGIVTKATVWLMPKPIAYWAFFISVDDQDFEALIDALRPLRLDGTLKSAMHIANADKAISAFQQYPWDEVEATPLPNHYRETFCKKQNISEWSASGALYGSRLENFSALLRILKALRPIRSKKFYLLNDPIMKLGLFLRKPYKILTGLDVKTIFEMLKPVYNLKRGIPTDHFMLSTYWRKRFLPSSEINCNPERDKCGLLWIAPIAPLTARAARRLADIVSSTLIKYKFDPAISMTLLTERCIDCVVSINYDRELEEEEARALECHQELKEKLVAQGFYPYRFSTEIMKNPPQGNMHSMSLLQDIKAAVDPKDIIAPGRYITR